MFSETVIVKKFGMSNLSMLFQNEQAKMKMSCVALNSFNSTDLLICNLNIVKGPFLCDPSDGI